MKDLKCILELTHCPYCDEQIHPSDITHYSYSRVEKDKDILTVGHTLVCTNGHIMNCQHHHPEPIQQGNHDE